MDPQKSITSGKISLGIELGSTRIKAVLIDENFTPIASGSHDWENRLEDGLWTYHLDDVWKGLQNCYLSLKIEVKNRYGIELTQVGSIGISAMMHGYLSFDKNENQLTGFRTWRNTSTEKAAAILTERFNFNIPHRWSIAHLYQAMLNGEAHVKDIDFITTLAGYVHWKLTGKKVLGTGDASGMFPVDNTAINNISSNGVTQIYDLKMTKIFSEIASVFNFNRKITDILPAILNAGEEAGHLTHEGSLLLSPDGSLKTGCPFCPPEGDAGTGMIATNSIMERTGNISAGTSIFAMIVLEKNLSKVYPEIDIVTTPEGKPVAMVHCNNCTSDIDAWIKLFNEVIETTGSKIDKSALYASLYNKALEADIDTGGLFSCNYYSGEPITRIEEGRPLFARLANSNFSLANFMRTLLFSAFATLKYGMDILTEKENVRIDILLGHGGLFKTKEIGQRFLSAALNAPVSVMENSAAEGGAWGIALLASYMLQKSKGGAFSLEQFLKEKVFADLCVHNIAPNAEDTKSFKLFMNRYSAGLNIEKVAVENLKA